LEENPDKINWEYLSGNPSAIYLIENIYERIKDRLNWCVLSSNPAIFTYDYDKLRDRMYRSGIAEGLAAFFFTIKKKEKWSKWGYTEYEELENEFKDEY